MRIIRLLSLAMLPMLAPLARAAAQTCQGTAEFRDGRARVDVDYQHASDLDHVQEGFTYGAQGSWYGGVTANQPARGGGGPDMNGFGGNVGYQIHWVDTPFQVCPMASLEFASGSGVNTTTVRFGGSLGYRVAVQPGFHLVPAAGIRWVSASTSGGGGTTSGAETFLNFGMVFHRVWSFVPGVLFPSQSNALTRWTFGLSYNWGP